MRTARFNGNCPLCDRRIYAGSPIAQDSMGDWGHASCATNDLERDRILSGDTFRSRKPSTWRRR